MKSPRISAIVLGVLISVSANAKGANPRGATTVPVMTALTVRLDEAVNVRTTANGSGFTASIKDPVMVDGVTIIPANASAAGLVSRASQSSGELELNSIFVNGRMYRVTTSPIAFSQKTNLHSGATMTFHLVLSLNIAR